MKQFGTVLLVLGLLSVGAAGLRLLLVFPSPFRSHYLLGNTLGKNLARLGHNVTLITYFREPNPPPNYTDIVLGEEQGADLAWKSRKDFFELEKRSPYAQLFIVIFMAGPVITEPVLNNAKVRSLLASGEHFDAVIIEEFLNHALKYFAYHFQAPLIAFNVVGSCRWVNNLVANPENPSYVSDLLLGLPERMTFKQRAYNVVFGLVVDSFLYGYTYPQQKLLLKKYYPEAPHLQRLINNVSLVLTNSHESFSDALPHVPSVVQIGGFHVDATKKLPKDLQQFMDEAPHGVIYFSLGSYLESANMPQEQQAAFFEVLRSRKERVLWKWDGPMFENQSANVKTSKWFPQHAVLAHPNCKLFISHGGLLSMIETIYFGVPTLAIPIFGDQKMNALRVQAKGYGLTMPLPQVTVQTLGAAVDQLLDDPKYRRGVQLSSQLLRDRPVQPMALTDYWIRYVVRHNGAPHLRVAAVGMPLYKYYMLDLLAVFLIGLVLTGWVLNRLSRMLLGKLRWKTKKE